MQPKQQGIVHFDSQPRGADIIIDGQILINPETEESVKTPASVSLYEGRHDFILRLHNSQDETGYVDVYPSTTVNIFRNMEPGKSEEGWGKPEPQIWLGSNVGTIQAFSEPEGAEIYIDGKPVLDQSENIVRTPITITDIPDGIREVTFTMDEYFEEIIPVEIYPGECSDVTATMRPNYKK
jgi:hypothetical protein